jgi:predicted CopG family antitoxin
MVKLTNVKIPDEVYTRLTKFKGALTNKTGKNYSYGETITYLLDNHKEGKEKTE